MEVAVAGSMGGVMGMVNSAISGGKPTKHKKTTVKDVMGPDKKATKKYAARKKGY